MQHKLNVKSMEINVTEIRCKKYFATILKQGRYIFLNFGGRISPDCHFQTGYIEIQHTPYCYCTNYSYGCK